MARPTFTPRAAPAADSTPAQKPDVRITPDALKKTKLSDIIERHKQATAPGAAGGIKKKGTVIYTAEEDSAKKGPGGGGAGGLNDIRRQRAQRRQTSRPSDDDDDKIVRGQKRHRRVGPVEL
ncbi:MAG TPA: hypothetical protein VM597_41395 [Gemmataceae bacterium]|nr:hypothetical protein [Gemmataceae bacterium]